jgi:hypothetical protein
MTWPGPTALRAKTASPGEILVNLMGTKGWVNRAIVLLPTGWTSPFFNERGRMDLNKSGTTGV